MICGERLNLEASLTADIKNLVITSCMEIRNKDLHDEIERISKESNDVSFEVTQGLSKRIVELEKDYLIKSFIFSQFKGQKLRQRHCDEAKVKDDFDELKTKKH
ncbi:hypothetical protein Tco_1491359 [Tanacetum coccineum]